MYNEKVVDKEYGEKCIFLGFIDIYDYGWYGGDVNYVNY